jgi:hypothetical protein
MEQQLINALVKLLAKAGNGELIKDLVKEVDENGNPKAWTPSEIASAIDFINRKTEQFGLDDARRVIHTLTRKFNLTPEPSPTGEAVPEVPGIQGLL